MSIYRNLKPIPIPADCKVNHYDNQVSRYYKSGDGKRRRHVVGWMTKEGLMVPNENFRQYFPNLWDEHYKDSDNIPACRLVRTGLYALTLGISYKINLYPILQDSFGPQYANAIMDFAMYSIRERTNVAQLMSEAMVEHMLFSLKGWSDSWYSKFFAKKMSLDKAHLFRIDWLKEQKKADLESVWLCIDGSNNDNAVQDSDLSAVGHAKSHRETEIVSYIWAVNAQDGRPVTYFVNNGSMPDCKAVDEVIKFLGNAKVTIKGVILDRGFVSQDVLKVIKDKGLDYILMLKNNNYGYNYMLEHHAQDICWNASMIVDDDALFGITDQAKLFANSEEDACIGLYFSAMAQTLRGREVIRKVRKGARKLAQRLSQNPKDQSVPKELRHYLKIEKNKQGKLEIKYNKDHFQKVLTNNGYFAIASGSSRSAEEIHQLYQLRDHSEKQFSVFKSQLGYDTTRVHSDQAIENRLAVGFVAALIRNEMQLACKALDLDVNVMLRKLDRVYVLRSGEGEYEQIINYGRDVEALLAWFGFTARHLEKLSDEITLREGGNYYDEIRTIPNIDEPKAGRPKGSKNKDKAKKDTSEASTPAQPRGRGRPKGSKNKSTLERERKIAEAKAKGEYEPPVKRSAGRPKGSKNKATLEREAKLKAQKEQEHRGRGRPKGSKNKKTLQREQAAAKQQPESKSSKTQAPSSAAKAEPAVAKPQQPATATPDQIVRAQNEVAPSEFKQPQDTNNEVKSDKDLRSD